MSNDRNKVRLSETCPRCRKLFKKFEDMENPSFPGQLKSFPENYVDIIAIDEHGMCKNCIINSGIFNQNKAARIIRELNNGGK